MKTTPVLLEVYRNYYKQRDTLDAGHTASLNQDPLLPRNPSNLLKREYTPSKQHERGKTMVFI